MSRVTFVRRFHLAEQNFKIQGTMLDVIIDNPEDVSSGLSMMWWCFGRIFWPPHVLLGETHLVKSFCSNTSFLVVLMHILSHFVVNKRPTLSLQCCSRWNETCRNHSVCDVMRCFCKCYYNVYWWISRSRENKKWVYWWVAT